MNDSFETIKKETDEAIDQSFIGADTDWRSITLNNFMRFCELTDTFTMNDFREYNRELCKIETHDNRAMGGIVKTARSNGWIEPTGHVIISRVGHKSLLQVWKSLILRKEI